MQDEITYVGAHAPPIDSHHVWAANPISLPHIRAQTRRWLAPLALDQDTEQDLVLAVNEAASNAIEHAYTAPGPADLVTVNCWTEPHHLCLEVTDHGRWRLPDATPGHRGHGILIMSRPSGRCSSTRTRAVPGYYCGTPPPHDHTTPAPAVPSSPPTGPSYRPVSALWVPRTRHDL
jgi:anti-sigma regulatory factor (Ser/Thr protein kinase)